jgi:hypothetical protein
MNKERIAIVLLMAVFFIVASIAAVKATSLSLEPTAPSGLIINGPPMNLTADDQDRDISIDPLEPLPANNGTVSLSTTGATDVDINEFPPIGVTVLIQNDSITVTKNAVSILDPYEQQALESNDDGSGSSDNGDEGE